MNRLDAQARADRIAAFTSELSRSSATASWRSTRNSAARRRPPSPSDFRSHIRFDLDRGDAQRRMSLGMRAVSLVGGIALSASVFLFFHRIWGLLSISVQVALLVAAPVAGVAMAELASRFDRSRHFVLVAALVACACIVLNIAMIGSVFAMPDSPNALLVWSLFALAIGYAYQLQLPVAGSLVLAIAFLSARAAAFSGAGRAGRGRGCVARCRGAAASICRPIAVHCRACGRPPRCPVRLLPSPDAVR